MRDGFFQIMGRLLLILTYDSCSVVCVIFETVVSKTVDMKDVMKEIA